MSQYIWQSPNWPHFTWDEKRLLPIVSQARKKQGRLLAKMEAWQISDLPMAEAEILIEEAVRTAQIEGEIYSHDQVRSSVARQLGLPFAGMPPVQRHVDGLVQVLIDATRGFDRPLTAKRLKQWQAALFPTGYSGMRQIRVGKWRQLDPMQVVSGAIGREKVHYQAMPSSQVQTEIQEFLKWWETSFGQVEGVLRAGVAHFWFVTIHPFEDGNGRVARALTDMALAQDEGRSSRYYSLSEQIVAQRAEYYQNLEQTQKGQGDLTEWLVWFVNCFSVALDKSEKLLRTVLEKAKFWQEHGLVSISDRQRKVVNKLLDAGAGGFQGGLTTRKYVAMTRISWATAYREIQDLIKKKMLKPAQAGGRSTFYEISW